MTREGEAWLGDDNYQLLVHYGQMHCDHHYFVYLLASRKNGTLYCGVTNDLLYRVNQHVAGEGSAFTRKYNIHSLVWYEEHQYIDAAIVREKIIKKWNRSRKINTIEEENPNWDDLSISIRGGLSP